MQDWEKDEIVIVDRARGNYLYDVQGRKYLDGVSSLWVTLHGHCHPYLNRALRRQLQKLDHSTLLGLSNTPAIELAARLLEIAPRGLGKVFYSDSGSTAMEIALKIAYQYWRQDKNKKYRAKQKFLTLSGAYHGDTIGSVSLGGVAMFHALYKPLLFKTIQIPTPYRHYGNEPDLSAAVAELEKAFKKHQQELAALVLEPLVQGAAGIYTAPAGYLAAARRLCTKYNVLLICDEVAVGFGRTGTMFACEQEKVSPDIMAVAKGLSGGYLPLAATLTTDKIYDNFKGQYESQRTFYHGHTYTGNPLACAAALASLDLFRREKTLDKVRQNISLLAEGLRRFETIPQVKSVRQCGLIAALELPDYAYRDKIGYRICLQARRRGLLVRPLENNIVILPPLSIQPRELSWLLAVLYQSIQEVVGLATPSDQ
ncbi:adenosylmethionine--8-amino-7-oxononanoate transaminase [Candidatus Termititenax persephonae]|uniref:Adenosylmethionine-8-amino-7-oxononanoate aminotransferase n=1 Tax=Candidatus Termititenax persephonae TaxID=2218525 RepID=A0A388TG52_9BACT|nr:adenosylmethionine--8-amino-7-oxononanoate transaminase [Candidatus Termititenax persephonae]